MPIIPLEDRVIMLENIKAVDKVIPDCPFGKITNEFIDEHKINQIYYAGEKNTFMEHWDRGNGLITEAMIQKITATWSTTLRPI